VIIAYLLQFLRCLTRCREKCRSFWAAGQLYGFLAAVLLFNIVSMFYGIDLYFFEEQSACIEINLFIMALAYIYMAWILVGAVGYFQKTWNIMTEEDDRVSQLFMASLPKAPF